MANLFNEFDRLIKSGDPQELELGILEFGKFIDSGEQSILDAAIMKLADLFVNVNNEFRLLIISQVEIYYLELNRCHLVASQVLRKLTYVWESNDYLGKVSVIRLFGLLPELIKDSPESLYRVIVSLDNPLSLLRKAALEASNSIAPVSSKFIELYVAKLSSLHTLNDDYFDPLRFAYTSPKCFARALVILTQYAGKSHKAKELLYTNASKVEFAARLVIKHQLLPSHKLEELKGLFLE